MKMGDDMMVKNARILLVVATAVVVAAGLLPGAASAGAVPHIAGVEAVAGPQGPAIRVSVDGVLETVHYSPQPGVWVVEMPDAKWDPGVARISAPELGVDRVELTALDEFGRRVTRLTVWLDKPAQADLVRVDGGYELRFATLDATGSVASPAPGVTSETVPEIPVVTEEPLPVEASPVPGVDNHSDDTSPAGASATSLLEVEPVVTGGGVVIRLRGDGPFDARTFTLANPDRVVLDLKGVVNHVRRHVYPLHAEGAARVRVAQHTVDPEPVTRIVVDMDVAREFRFAATSSGGELVVGNAGPVTAVSPAPGIIEMHRSEPAPVEASTANSGEEPVGESIEIGSPTAVTQAEQEAPAPAVSWQTPAAPVAAPAETAPVPPAQDPWTADPSQLVEQAAAAQVLAQEPGTATFAAKELATQERQFTGEPITMTLKDADIKDVLRTFAGLTNLNIVVDPGVSGSVTVELHDVPWDQALDLILRINGLDYVLENNVLRVAPISKLASEKRAAAAYAKEQEAAKPLKVVLKPISYAQASEIMSLLKGDSQLLSERGTIQVDERTNTLIIRDVIDRVDGILRLIDSLDKPTPQVVIEGRIVETTRDFSRQLGINWGFTGVMDAEHGNDTGLKFPNNINTEGRVALEAGRNGLISMTFGDILNTFNLDFTLTAAEKDGVVRIVSSPRVTTQNMERATIRSGLQIPVQTVANNTVTVQYVDATLRLDVTPQITAEGTVILDVNIKKQEPVLAASELGGQNAPIFTRDAQTHLLVRDGGTTVIAGIYQLKDDNSQDRVPGLHKIPILGWLFKNEKTFNRHDELLIFITPRIIKY